MRQREDVERVSSTQQSMETITDKIQKALNLFHEYSGVLVQHPVLADLMEAYQKAIQESWDLMNKLRIPATCHYCATQIPGGGCCGKGVDDWYDEYLLLINLLMGVTLPSERTLDDSCIFLGTEGCMLAARYHFCVNYLCRRITADITSHEEDRLKRTYGHELHLSWLIEKELRRVISSHGPDRNSTVIFRQ